VNNGFQKFFLAYRMQATTQRYLGSLNAGDAMKAHTRFSPLDNAFKQFEDREKIYSSII
jgi:hypothetical protein